MIRVSAPGKAILMGEHAAVYGRPALVAALDRRVHVLVDPHPANRPANEQAGTVDLDLPQLAVRRRDTWSDLRRTLDQITAAEDRSHLARVALGEAVGALDEAARQELSRRSVAVRITSEIPVGSGFGSSAAVAVGVVRAVFALAGAHLNDETLYAVSLDIERRQHGSPSGVDNAAVIRGGVLWVARDPEGGLAVRPLGCEATESPILDTLRIFHTGEPAESTGDVVSAVATLRTREPAAFERRLKIMEATARAFRDLLDPDVPVDPVGALSQAIDLMRRFEACLEGLGVVPHQVAERIRLVEEAGGAAKISGAGSLAGPGAGSLLVLHPSPEVLDRVGALDGFERLDVRLGGEGVRIDRQG